MSLIGFHRTLVVSRTVSLCAQGVPQGSCLRPLLFTIYASKLFQIIRNHLSDVHAYADDAQLYLSFKPDSAMDAMERCVNDIRTWMIVDKRKINDGKTEFMVIGMKQQLRKINIEHLMIGVLVSVLLM